MISKTKNVSAMVQIPVAAKGQTEVKGLKEVRAQVAVMGHAAVREARVARGQMEVRVPKAHAVQVSGKKGQKV
jgi:hypothetical protein